MMDMTMRSSMRVKPESGARFEVRGARDLRVRDVVFMSCGYLSRLTAIEYRRFAGRDDTAEIAILDFRVKVNFLVDLRG
jgi:hypothetical protein